MENKIVTVAECSFERAQLLKTLLEDCKIEVFLENINLLDGTYIKGARVCVYEKNAAKTLMIVEEAFQRMDIDPTYKKGYGKRRVLIPIDFSQNSEIAVKLGFQIAEESKGEITFIHVFYNPMIGGIPFPDSFSYSIDNDENIVVTAAHAHQEMKRFLQKIEELKQKGELPNLLVKSEVLTGIPEDEILNFAEDYHPSIIVMGTRGSSKKEVDMIGSVAAEVIDRTQFPVLTIPIDANPKIEGGMKLMYITNFEERDFQSFDKLTQLLENYKLQFYIVHLAEKDSMQNKARLDSMEKIFRERYGDNENVNTYVLHSEHFLEDIEAFIRDNNINIISITTHRRNIFARLFNPGIARKMLFHTDTPMLIFNN